MNFKILVLFAFLFAVTHPINAQNSDNEKIINEIIEELSNDVEDEIDLEEVHESLTFISHNKIDINNCSYDDLSKLYFLNEFQIRCLLDYIGNSGQIHSIYELQGVYGFDQNLLERLNFFIYFNEKLNTNYKSNRIKQKVLFRWGQLVEDQKAYLDSTYLGSKDRIYFKYQYEGSNLKFGYLGEKDAGEDFFSGSNVHGFDFNSAYLQLKFKKLIKSVYLGDFHANFGQGLVIQTSPVFNGSSQVLNKVQRNIGFKKYSSATEFGFLRGFATDFSFNDFHINLFSSVKKIDAKIENSEISSFPETGYHYTISSINNEKQSLEFTSGLNIAYQKPNIKIGLIGTSTLFEYEPKQNEELYQRFNSVKKNNLNSSIYYKARFRNTIFFGENAMNQSFGSATYNGALFLITDQVNFLLSHRYATKNYYSIYGNSFFTGSNISSEKGVYGGIELNPIARLNLSASFNFYSFPWLKYMISSPSNAIDYYLKASYSLKYDSKIDFFYKYRNKASDQKTEIMIIPFEYQKQNYRIDYNYKANANIEIKHRMDLILFNAEKLEKGFLVLTDFGYAFNELPLKLKIRYAYFKTDSYNTRAYAYENDVLYSFSIPSYSGEGIRYYLLFQYKLYKGLDIWARVAQFQYFGVSEIGSGNNLIKGNRKTEIKFQIQYKF